MAVNIDDMLRRIGEFGRFQWIMGCVIGYCALACGGIPTMIVTFITAEQDWMCVNGYNNSICNFTEPISLTSKHYKARCSMPREAWTYVSDFTSTVSEYDLVCDKSLLQSIAQSCYWVGFFFGLVTGGYLSDNFGRRKIFYSGCALVAVATWIMVFPKSFIVFIVCRIFIGFGGGFRNSTSFVLLTEFTTERYRAKFGVLSFYFWVAGSLLIPLIGYFIRDWRIFLLITAVIATPVIFTWWFIPESTRYLLLHGKEKKARKQLEKIARINGKPFPDDQLEQPNIPDKRGSWKDLFCNWKWAKTTLISWDLWFAVSLVYYGVSYGSVDLGGNKYLNVALTTLVEIPSNFVAVLSADRFGRKKTVLSGLVIAFVASVISILIPSDRSNAGYNGGRILVAILAKFFVNFAFTGVYIWSAELFPTVVRSMGCGTSSAAARLGSFGASYIVWLIRIHSLLPYGIMGFICLQAAILSTFLPETKGQSTLETMNDETRCETIKNSMLSEKEVADTRV